LCVIAICSCSDEKPEILLISAPPEEIISVGSDVGLARKIFDSKNIYNNTGGFAFATIGPGDEDAENLIVIIDPEHMMLCIWYSKSTGAIDKMTSVCMPSKQSGRAYESWIPITAVEFLPSGEYKLTFSKPE